MRDVLDELLRWWRAGHPVAVATVVATFRSAPRPPGAVMLVGPAAGGGLRAVGSVSGGCVEGAVFDLASETVESGHPTLTRYGISDDDAFAVGLTCGGILDIFTERIDPAGFPEFGRIADDVAAGRPVAIATVIEHPDESVVGRRMIVRPEPSSPGRSGPDPSSGGNGRSSSREPSSDSGPALASARMDDAVRDDALGLLGSGTSETLTYGADGQRRGEGCRVFVSAFAPRPRMIVFGAIDFAAATARMGSFLGYHVTVCDARPVFATATRFPDADEVVTDWPHRYLEAEAAADRLDERTVVCVLTHDPKFDVPVLQVALRLGLAYVGAMGSRRTHDDRFARLREAGMSDAELAGLSSPIGLDLGARTPEETAVSVAAEIVTTRWGGTGRSLTHTSGRIHGDA